MKHEWRFYKIQFAVKCYQIQNKEWQQDSIKSVSAFLFVVQLGKCLVIPLMSFTWYSWLFFSLMWHLSIWFASLEVDSVDSFQDDQLSSNFMAEEADSLKATYIRKLNVVLIQHVPAFWRLALYLFSRKLAKVLATYLAILIPQTMVTCICNFF